LCAVTRLLNVPSFAPYASRCLSSLITISFELYNFWQSQCSMKVEVCKHQVYFTRLDSELLLITVRNTMTSIEKFVDCHKTKKTIGHTAYSSSTISRRIQIHWTAKNMHKQFSLTHKTNYLLPIRFSRPDLKVPCQSPKNRKDRRYFHDVFDEILAR
jgi:hypothetical protein